MAEATIFDKIFMIIQKMNVVNVNQTFNEDCVICLEGFDNIENNDIITITCGHKFHHECIGNLVLSQLHSNSNIACPICRFCLMENTHELYVNARRTFVQANIATNDNTNNTNEPLTLQEHTRLMCIILGRLLILLIIFAICVIIVGLVLFFVL